MGAVGVLLASIKACHGAADVTFGEGVGCQILCVGCPPPANGDAASHHEPSQSGVSRAWGYQSIWSKQQMDKRERQRGCATSFSQLQKLQRLQSREALAPDKARLCLRLSHWRQGDCPSVAVSKSPTRKSELQLRSCVARIDTGDFQCRCVYVRYYSNAGNPRQRHANARADANAMCE